MFKDCTKFERNVFVTWKKDDVNEQDCYKCIKIDKTEQDWSFNQFAVHASEYSV